MCLFVKYNHAKNSIAYKKGIHEFDCGQCPECLQKKSRLWALRCCAESFNNAGCMVTLTYDNFIRDDRGNIIGETPADTRPLSKRDCQLFIKRLRKYFTDHNPNKRKLLFIKEDKKLKQLRVRYKYLAKKITSSKGLSIRLISEYLRLPSRINHRIDYIKNYNKQVKEYNKNLDPVKISYLLTAEHGKSTGRSHYHAILFGVEFNDRIFHKRSKRGNSIYTSPTLEKIWNNGICTIDAVNISGKIARYCTKYCAKDSRGVDDTFMLMSRNIGDKWLCDNFNGKSYIIDGREYSIPKQIWNKFIEYKYRNNFVFNYHETTYKYRSLRYLVDKFGEDKGYALSYSNVNARRRFRNFRDSDKQYKEYLAYWQRKCEQYNSLRPNVYKRITQLPDDKYFTYKQACFKYLTTYDDLALPSGVCARYYERVRIKKIGFRSFALKPLVIKGQMTPKTQYKVVDCGYKGKRLVTLEEINCKNVFKEYEPLKISVYKRYL